MSTTGSLIEEALQSFQDYGFGFKTTNIPGFPKIEITGDDKKITIKALVAGYKKEDLKVEYRGDLLTISTKPLLTKDEAKTEERVFYSEIKRSSFTRQLYINPKLIDMTKRSAKIEEGVLIIELERAEFKMNSTYLIPIE